MPFCKVSSDLTLHYITNFRKNDVARLDPSKPTILLLHPVAVDATWLRQQFQDPRLSQAYNMIAFDQRNIGRTKSSCDARRDSYVDAADLGFAHELLQLPPVHVFAANGNSVYAAVRFALLFPKKCLSLCLCGVPADQPLDWVPKAYADLISIWCFPPDLETFEQANMEMSYFMFSGRASTQIEDEIVAWWQVNMPPRRRRAVVELTFSRIPPTAEEYARIKQPTLLITGDQSNANPVEEAVKTHNMIAGSQFYVVKGAPEMGLVLPQYSSIINRVFVNFLQRLDPPPVFTLAKPNLLKIAKEALARLAEISGKASIASKDPLDPISFCMWSPEALASNQAMLDQMAAGEDTAFSPLDLKGAPIRLFSSRHDDQWSWAAFDKMSRNLQGAGHVEIRRAL